MAKKKVDNIEQPDQYKEGYLVDYISGQQVRDTPEERDADLLWKM